MSMTGNPTVRRRIYSFLCSRLLYFQYKFHQLWKLYASSPCLAILWLVEVCTSRRKFSFKFRIWHSITVYCYIFQSNLYRTTLNPPSQHLESVQKKLGKTLVAVDGTLHKTLPKMLWALWLDDEHRAAKMHLEFDIIKGIPVNAQLTKANASEIARL